MRSESGIDMIEIFALWLHKNGMETEQGGKIIKRHCGKAHGAAEAESGLPEGW